MPWTTLPIAASAPRLSDACGEHPGLPCREVFESTHSRALAQIVDFLVGPPLTILAILLAATIVNRLARRAIKRGLRRLASGTLRERLGAIKRVADEIWRERPAWVLEEPELWGVEALGPHGLTIRLVMKTQPSRQWEVGRIARERLKEAFDEEGIEIPFPQQVVWHRHADDAKAAGAPAAAR